MRKIDIISNYINEKITYEHLLKNIEDKNNLGVTANEIQSNLDIVRNNASTMLNQLWKLGKLIKINSRPVSFVPKKVIMDFSFCKNKELKNIYSLEEFTKIIQLSANNKVNPFQYLIGYNNSLSNQIGQAKAAIMYPPNGLHMLLLGESGVGKTTFASAIYEYAKINKQLKRNSFPFVSFNCSDYFNNPQLLLSQLFGHVKGAFTGADSDKIGIVEKANGGILFLDEVHRLPPDGQEMLFYLMDKGKYHRLGETCNTRKCNILIIAATTEDPNEVLLSTFLRRIPVVITLPSFREKTIEEKIEIIEHLFYYEAIKLNKNIKISPEVIKALAIYSFKSGNIGQLKSEIKFLCAKSFLGYLQNNKELYIDFKMLSKEIRDYVFNESNLNTDIKSYFEIFTEDLIITPSQNKEYHPKKINKNIYDTINKKMDELKNKGLDKEVIDTEINSIIEEHFKNIINNFDSNSFNIRKLYKIVPKDIVDVSTKLINIAQNELQTKFNSKFIFGFSLHIHSLLKRINENKSIKNPNMIKIKKEYPEEFRVSKIIIKKLSEKFAVIIPEDEKGFLAILLANNTINKKSEDKVGIIVICHGNSTASSMAEVANTLLNTNFVKAIDMPLDCEITEIYNKFKSASIAIDKGKGILLLVDMGSLINFGEKLNNETGIKVRTINNVSTLLVLEALRNILYKNSNIDTIYRTLINKDIVSSIKTTDKKKVILTVCVTGQGAGMIAKKILSDILEKQYKNKIEIISTNYMNIKKNIQNITQKYDIVACIGSIKPKIEVPYFPINKLLNKDFQKNFLKFLDTKIDYSIDNGNSSNDKSVYEISKDMLDQYVKYINPKFAIINIKKFIKNLKLNTENQNKDNLIDLIVHMGCMLDRCIHGDSVKFDNVEDFKNKNYNQFTQIRKAANILASEYGININDDEICYIIKVINK